MADNTSTPPVKGKRGGARAGAGRPVKAHVTVPNGTPALEFLTRVYESDGVPMPLRIRAAGLVVGATVQRPGAEKLGKKAARQIQAEVVAAEGGPFAPGRAPFSVVGKA